MTRRALFIPFALLAACSPKGGSAGGSADSAATALDSAAMARDSVRLDSVRLDSVRLDSVARADSAGTKSKAPAPTVPGKVIGRDSAFGPRYTVDSTGKLIPLPIRRP